MKKPRPEFFDQDFGIIATVYDPGVKFTAAHAGNVLATALRMTPSAGYSRALATLNHYLFVQEDVPEAPQLTKVRNPRGAGRRWWAFTRPLEI